MTEPHRITYTEPSVPAARRRYARMRKADHWQDVRRDGRNVSALRVCTVCTEPITSDDELRRHWIECEGIVPAVLA